jgi:putative ABC transport system substrate-binding protein
MRRREFITLLGGTTAIWPIAGRAQQIERVRRIGVLMGSEQRDADSQARLTAFRHGLRELGWAEDRNIRIDERWAANVPARLRAYAAELVSLTPDVILAHAPPAISAVRRETGAVPIAKQKRL